MPKEAAKSIPETISELKQLTVDYAKQEVTGPLKGLAVFVGKGLAGSLLLGLGLFFLLLAMLRALQTETTKLNSGSLSWMPYFLTWVVAVLCIVLTVVKLAKGKNR